MRFSCVSPAVVTASTQHTHLDELMVASFPPPGPHPEWSSGLWAFGLHAWW